MSIFGIDSNSYGSILSQTKELKESKESSKANFANVFLKKNASKLSEIQSENLQTLARSESLNSKDKVSNQINSFDTNLNKDLKNLDLKTNSLNSNSQITSAYASEFQNAIYALKYKSDDTDLAVSMAYGYGVNKDGYMTSDFNEAANLPKDFKIHKSTLEEIEKAAENDPVVKLKKEYLGINQYYQNIDMAETIKQYYNLFSNALNQSFPSDKAYFSEKDINSLPKGYAVNGVQGVNYDDPNNRMNITHLRDFSQASITNIYKTTEQMEESKSLFIQSGIYISGLEGHSFGFSLEELQNVSKGEDWQFTPNISAYPKGEDGSYPKEALFVSFIKSYAGGQPVESPNTTLNPTIEAYNTAMAKESFNGSSVSFNDIMTGKIDFASLLKGHAQDGWLDANIYAMENGIKWQNSTTGYGGIWFDRQFKEAKNNSWNASNTSIDTYVGSVMDRLQNLMNQTRV